MTPEIPGKSQKNEYKAKSVISKDACKPLTDDLVNAIRFLRIEKEKIVEIYLPQIIQSIIQKKIN